MDKHLIVVSVDAMVYEDLDLLTRLPNVSRLLLNGSLVRSVTTIYPSLTHPVHATLMTGCRAGKTGIYNNEVFIPGEANLPWNNELRQLNCDTLFHAAHRAGLTTCACRWPMTSGGFDRIDWLVPEVLDFQTAEEPDPEKLYASLCTPEIFEDIVKPNLHYLRRPEKYPNYEIFSMRCACGIIRKYRPNLVMTHPGMVDHNRHESGLFGPSVADALRMTDEWIGWLMDAAEEAGIADTTSFAIVSDHGHLKYARTVSLNAAFRELGWLHADERGKLLDWAVCAKSAGLSAQIYVKDAACVPEIHAKLTEMARLGIYGFNEVLTVDETRERYGLYGDFSFVVETDGCTAFSDDLNGPISRTNPNAENGAHHSSHGHMPEKGPQPIMILSGPAFQNGAVVEHTHVVNEAPTFAAALGIALKDAEGCPIREVLVADRQI